METQRLQLRASSLLTPHHPAMLCSETSVWQLRKKKEETVVVVVDVMKGA